MMSDTFRRISRRNAIGAIGGGLAWGLSSVHVRAQAAPAVMKLGTQTLNDSQHEWMKIFARLVEDGSKGRIKVEVYPASQLGTAPRMIEGTQFGSIQGFVAPPEFLAGVDSRFEVLGSPGLFKDAAHANRTLQEPEFNKAFLAVGANKGLKGVGLFINAPAVFITRNKATRLADLENLKVRVFASAVQMEQMRKLKATPVPMPLGEVLPALQQGTIDGVMSVLPVLAALRFYDAAKYILETEHAMVSVVTVLSKLWYDKLPKDLQAIVEEAGQKASVEVFPWAIDYIAKQRQAWQTNKGEVARLSPAEQERMNQLLRPVGAEVASKKPDEAALFEILRKSVAKTS
jgi:TRAP-type C4-dicarboxylate transport system substrate-binding protein